MGAGAVFLEFAAHCVGPVEGGAGPTTGWTMTPMEDPMQTQPAQVPAEAPAEALAEVPAQPAAN